MADANPGELSASVLAMQPRLELMRACYGGTETMRAKQEDFLPRYDKESIVRWQTRLDSTTALNKLREAVDAASAKPFRTILQLTNTDPDLDMMIKDIDLQGNHLHVFAHQLFNAAMLDGMSHIMVDHPDTIDMPNLGAQKAAGVRPFFKLIKQQDIIAAYDEYVGGDNQTVHVRLRSSRTERTPDFKEIVWNQIYVVEKEPGTEKGVAQLWEQQAGQGSGGSWALVAEKAITLAEVPLATLYAGDKEANYVVRPIFMDLAYKQIEHYQSSSDQRSILSAARFPMLACSGVQLDPEDETEFAIGPYKVLYSPEANGRWYYVEPKGTAIDSGHKDLEMLEMQMDMMALNPVTGTHRQYVPQNERNIQETRVHSVVHDLTISAQDTVEKAVRFIGMWTGRDYSEVQCIMNKDFSSSDETMGEVTKLIDIWSKRGISRETMLREAKARNLLSENFDIATEVAKLEAADAALANTTPMEQDPAKPVEEQEPVDFPNGQDRPTRQL